MAKARTSISIDQELLTAVKVVAAALGKTDSEVMEEALEDFLTNSSEESRSRLQGTLDRIEGHQRAKAAKAPPVGASVSAAETMIEPAREKPRLVEA